MAAELAQRPHLVAAVAGLAGGGQPGPEVAHRFPVGAADVTGLAPGDEGAAQQLGRAGPLSLLQRAGEQRLGVGGGEPRQGLLPGEQKGPCRTCSVSRCRGVPADHLGLRRREVGGPPVVGATAPAPGSWRRGSPGPGRWRTRSRARRRRAAPRRWPRPARATACAGRSSIPATTAGSTDAPSTAPARRTSSASRPTRRSRARTAACSVSGGPVSPAASPRRVSTTNSGCPRVRRRIVAASSPWPASCGQSGHRLVRQRAEVEPLGDVGQDVEGVGTLIGAQCGEHEQPRRRGVPGQVVQQLHGRQAGLVQVVEQQQRRPVGGQPAQHRGDGLVGPPDLDLRSAVLDGGPELVDELGPQAGERGRARPGQRPQPGRGQRGEGRVERVDERLEEQRALARVAAGGEHPSAGASTVSASSAASRVLPMPPSPATRSSAGRPAVAAAQAAVEPAHLSGAARQGRTGGRPRGRGQRRVPRPFQSGGSR